MQPINYRAMIQFDQSRYQTHLFLSYFVHSLPNHYRQNQGFRNNSVPAVPKKDLILIIFCD